MAASALKMAAICAVLVVILMSAMGQPAMAYVNGQPLACPSAETPCRLACIPACNAFAEKMCSVLCALAPGAGQTCVNQLFTPCQVTCKNLCEPLPGGGAGPYFLPIKSSHVYGSTDGSIEREQASLVPVVNRGPPDFQSTDAMSVCRY
ncbi:hypothetical protein TRIUR3_25873 [Triticum urartu]|uniref:Uncharacterized protein n=1 Tax=Triticum urartu TaxID=4572 RepID=M7YHP9_TRIUA|nr:hypothetical protein TRIUR3_25873 [Triticum urartu]